MSWRWAVAANVDGDKLLLQLQALPVSGEHIKGDPAFSADNLAVVVLASFPLEVDMFDGDLAAGPVPLFFSSKPEETLAKISSRPSAAHNLCQALAGRFLITEGLTSKEAVSLDGKPRIGKAEPPFIRAWREPPPKRQRAAESLAAGHLGFSAAEAAGKITCLEFILNISNKPSVQANI
jgi:hypothetical protein